MKKHKSILFPDENITSNVRLKKQIAYLRKLPPELIAKVLQKKLNEDGEEELSGESYSPQRYGEK